MRETSSYLKLSLATLCHQEMGSFDASLICLDKITGFLKILYLIRFMLINVNENFFDGLLIQLNEINP